MTHGLQLGRNEPPVKWFLGRVSTPAPVSRQSLLLLQNSTVFHAELGVTKSIQINDVEKGERVDYKPG